MINILFYLIRSLNLQIQIRYLFLISIYFLASTAYSQLQQGSFTHGVASGDPGMQSIVLWTRYLSVDSTSSILTYELSRDTSFSTILSSGTVTASLSHDYCTKVLVSDLEPGTVYFYRFKKGQIYSTRGRTKTLPETIDQIKIGVVNCAKYTGGYYHAYDALAQMSDIDVVIHLGDYIYESGPSTPKSSYWEAYKATGRQHDPLHECISLQDYRTRYAQYRSDPALQKLHAQFPMIVIWDDHEIAMKKHKHDSTGKIVHNDNWEQRRDHSIVAYHEWLPLKPAAFEPIYRSFQFGNLVNLMMLDTRVCCKSEVPRTTASLKDTSRHIIGNQQLRWIQQTVLQSGAIWNVFGNQILLATKGKGWERWQGFPYDRSRFLNFVAQHPDKNFVFTTGNAHNPHHYIIFGQNKSDTLIHELLPGSISSGNNSEKARYDPAILAKEEKRLEAADNVLWFHQDSHGFIILDMTPQELVAKWYFVSSIRRPDYELTQPYTTRILSN